MCKKKDCSNTGQTQSPVEDFERDRLLDAYISETLSDQQADKLFELLKNDTKMERELFGSLVIETALNEIGREKNDHVAVSVNPTTVSEPRVTQPSQRVRAFAWFANPHLFHVAVVAVIFPLIVLGFGLWYYGANQSRDSITLSPSPESERKEVLVEKNEPISHAIALVQSAVDVVWKENSRKYRAGESLGAGWIRLESGSLCIQFFSGAKVILQGPAEFQLLSSNKAFCPQGRIIAEVPPPATGFTVNVPQMVVVDRGTSFYLSVEKDSSEVHVLKGEVDLMELPVGPTKLITGEAASVQNDGIISRFCADKTPFQFIELLKKTNLQRERDVFDRWQKAGVAWNSDPALLIRFDFQAPIETGGRVYNLAHVGSAIVGDGVVIGCNQVAGGIPGKKALEFRRLSDRICVNVPGQYHSLSFAAWVRVDSLERNFNALFMSNGFTSGNVHWQLRNAQFDHSSYVFPSPEHYTNLRVGIHEPAILPSPADYDSSPIFPGVQLGQWVHVASTIDVDTQTVNHYLNGKLITTLPFRHIVPLQIGNAEIGNWNRYDNENITPIRYFNGCISEFMLLSRTLTPEEVLSMVSCRQTNVQETITIPDTFSHNRRRQKSTKL